MSELRFTLEKRISEWFDDIQSIKVSDGFKEHVDECKQFAKRHRASSIDDAQRGQWVQNFLSGRELNDFQMTCLADLICQQVNQQSIFKTDYFDKMMQFFQEKLDDGKLGSLAWNGLLCSYFEIPNFSEELLNSNKELEEENKKKLEKYQDNKKKLQNFLLQSWPAIDKKIGNRYKLSWVEAIRSNQEILGDRIEKPFIEDVLKGEGSLLKKTAEDLGIIESSWFFSDVVKGCIDHVSGEDSFFENLNQLINLCKQKPSFENEILTHLLEKAAEVKKADDVSILRDYAIEKWGNPKLKFSRHGGWNRLTERAYRNALSWVNQQNLKDFFELLVSRRHNADKRRSGFWAKYLNQIIWTKLIFSERTMDERSRDDAIKEIVDREEGTYGILNTGHIDYEDLDIFMMQIRGYIIVEYSKTGNAAYLYEATKLPFNAHKKEYKNVSDLKIRENLDIDGKENRILHQGAWEYNTEARLKRMDIFPDSVKKAKDDILTDDRMWNFTQQEQQRKNDTSPTQKKEVTSSGVKNFPETPRGAKFTMEELEKLIKNFPEARIEDLRSKGGRLWVYEGHKYIELMGELPRLGFKWAAKKMAYYKEDE